MSSSLPLTARRRVEVDLRRWPWVSMSHFQGRFQWWASVTSVGTQRSFNSWNQCRVTTEVKTRVDAVARVHDQLVWLRIDHQPVQRERRSTWVLVLNAVTPLRCRKRWKISAVLLFRRPLLHVSGSGQRSPACSGVGALCVARKSRSS